jgi:16S rRNA (guanine527-N7)-methyltransferase
VHVADSLAALSLLRERAPGGPLVDIGSGAGFPGLPLAIALEPAEVVLLEATGRKCAFIERAIERLGLASARAVCARAEDWGAGEGAIRYAAATARAVGPLATLVEYAAPLLRPGGVLVAWKGARDGAEEEAAARAAATLGMTAREVLRTEPFAGARNHHLHVFEKVGPTPPGYPRRPGMARKRPLGRS